MARYVLLVLLVALPTRAQDGLIAVQGALDFELGPLIEAVGNPEPRVIDGFSFWEGTIGGAAVVVSRTEVGMVNAAVATTLLVRELSPSVIINQGTAGAVDPELRVGDLVLGRSTAPFGAFRTASRNKGAGVRLEDWEILPRTLRLGGERVPFEKFDSDPELLSLAAEIPYRRGRVVQGVIGSADQWNREIDKLLWAGELYGIASEDMESASAHQVAQIYGIPFLAVRVISNSEHNDPEYHRETGADCAQFVVSLVEKLAASPSP